MILEQVAYDFVISYVKQKQKEKNIAKQICTKDGSTIVSLSVAPSDGLL